MTASTTTTDAAESDRYVFIERARCPKCGSDDLHTTRGKNQGDGSTCTTTNCRTCKHHFFIITE
jgi:hypothetical protein